MTTKLHAVTDADGRPIRFFMTAGQVSDYTGAAALFPNPQTGKPFQITWQQWRAWPALEVSRWA